MSIGIKKIEIQIRCDVNIVLSSPYMSKQHNAPHSRRVACLYSFQNPGVKNITMRYFEEMKTRIITQHKFHKTFEIPTSVTH